jgi:hypothetical protein
MQVKEYLKEERYPYVALSPRIESPIKQRKAWDNNLSKQQVKLLEK